MRGFQQQEGSFAGFGEFCCSSALADAKIELSVTFCTDHRREHS